MFFICRGSGQLPLYLLEVTGPLLDFSGAVNTFEQGSPCPMLVQTVFQQGAGLDLGSAVLQYVKCSMACLS